ncbi:MAG: bifunctional D-glycero-beta-D-manno-heptose-7-phosphate kinase/D-glycero-beta-D-manno-heptose 1-phosphate adenylyltransferase HldE [Pseudomonadota bacterium]
MHMQNYDFTNINALVVGDVMIDRYWQGDTVRISPEAPVPIVRVTGCEDRVGGAANVAMNLASLGVQTRLMGLCGADEAGAVLAAQLQVAGIDTHLQEVPGCPTITKLRVLSRHQQLLRLDFESHYPDDAARGMLASFNDLLRRVDIVILSDYGKGSLSQAPALISAARAAGIPVLVDPKGADFERYRGATAITPNLHEFLAVAESRQAPTDLAAAGDAWCRKLGLERLVVTRGEEGISLFDGVGGHEHLPARARDVFDVTGAGDTVIAVLAAARAAGMAWTDAAALANVAAGWAVGRLGTVAIGAAELREAVGVSKNGDSGMMTEQDLLQRVACARAKGERIVMTNGCFDMLHPGHIRYLREARALGDRLIVAVNDDDSVRRLKGPQRPVNPLPDRAAMLSALDCVDWVVGFSEDTPARLIGAVQPDVLVKGGDYAVNEIAGGDQVRAGGGEVRVLPFVPGYSTTGLLERVRRGEG